MRIDRLAAALAALVISGVSAPAEDAAVVNPASLELLTTEVQVAADGSSVQTVHAEMRANNEAAAMQIARSDIPFVQKLQELEILEAHTLKPDGTKIPVDVNTIYEQLSSQQAQLQMLTDQRSKTILFPQFGAGDTAVYTIRIRTLRSPLPGGFVFAAIFPHNTSFKQVRGTLTAPESLALKAEKHDVELTVAEKNGNTVFSWHYTAPAVTPLPTAQVSLIDRTPRLFISSFRDYAGLGKAYAAAAQPKIEVTARIAALAGQITAGVADRREQARRIYEWVSTHIRYVAVELGQGTFVPHDVDSIVANGYGDCKDHDVVLQALLKAKGIAAESLLINSGNDYTLTEAPTFVQLDHVITRLPEFNLYLDSSVGIAPFGVLPFSEYGKPVVRISAATAVADRIPLLTAGDIAVATTTVESLSADGVLSGSTTTTATGPDTINLRSIGLAIQGAGPLAANQFMAAQGRKDATGDFTIAPPLELTPSYTVTGKFSWPGWADEAEGKANFLMPGGLRVLGLTGDGMMGPYYPGELKDGEPTPCYSGREVETLSLKAPPGMRFMQTPSDTRIETSNLTFTAHWTLADDTLSVHREFAGKIDRPLCTGDIRRQTAAALKQISDSYDNTKIMLGSAGAAAEEKIRDALRQASEAGKAMNNKKVVQLITELLASEKPQGDLLYSAYVTRAFAYLNLNNKSAAIRDLDEAIKIKPDAADLRKFRASMLAYTDREKDSVGDLSAVLRDNPDDTSSLLARARAYQAAGKYDEATTDYIHAAKIKPADIAVRTGLCDAVARSQVPEDAVAPCTRLLKDSPLAGTELLSRGIAYFQMGKFQDALRDFALAAKTYPTNAEYLYARGAARIKTGDKDGGQRDIDAAKKMAPDIAKKMKTQKIAV
jgi:tetratricopeptide (TPR) repeat protein